MTAKDSSGNILTTNSYDFVMEVNDQWNVTAKYQCVDVTNQTDMFATPSSVYMTGLGNGTYTSRWISNVEGNITLIVYALLQGIYVEYFDNNQLQQPFNETGILSNVNQTWGTGTVFGTFSDNISLSMTFYIKAPYTEDYTFTLESNDGSDLFVDDQSKISQSGNTCNCTNDFNISLVQNQYYKFK